MQASVQAVQPLGHKLDDEIKKNKLCSIGFWQSFCLDRLTKYYGARYAQEPYVAHPFLDFI